MKQNKNTEETIEIVKKALEILIIILNRGKK